jgi:hypothetical protein
LDTYNLLKRIENPGKVYTEKNADLKTTWFLWYLSNKFYQRVNHPKLHSQDGVYYLKKLIKLF